MEVIGFQQEDVLDLAVQMEENGVEFYELAAKSASETAQRLMLSGLAGMERDHKADFEKLKERRVVSPNSVDPEVDAAVSGFLASWLEGEVFDKDAEAGLEVARSGAMADVLRVAIRMEKNSIALYTGLREYVADDEAQQILDRISKEELQHVADLSNALRDVA